MFRKILLASDLSESSYEIIGCMDNLKSLHVEEVILFYAMGFQEKDTVSEMMLKRVEPELKKQQEKLQSMGFSTTLEIALGMPSEEIKRVSKEREVSVMIIGSHGSSAFTHSLFRLGGVASEILNSHEKPLLFLRTKAVHGIEKPKFQAVSKNFYDKILFATDFSDISMLAFEYVEKFVEDGAKDITLVHVQDKSRIAKHLDDKLEEFNRIDTERLEMRKDRLIKKGASNVEIKIPYGIPTEEIINEAHKGHSLVVMGSQGRGYFSNVFIGSVSYKVARNSDVSVLLVPSKWR